MSCSDSSTTSTEDNPTESSTAPTTSEPEMVGTPTSISGTISGLQDGQKIFFDKKTLDATDVLGTSKLDASGNFDLTVGIPSPGIYRVRLGAKPLYMLLKGGETINVTAQMNGYQIESYTLTGGMHAEEMDAWNQDLDKAKILDYLTNTTEDKPLLHLYLVEKLDLAANIETYKKVLETLIAAYPNAVYTKQFTSKVLSMEAKLKNQPVAVGVEAPEIDLPNPDGKSISLSSLRGKVVLLDFWASWCRPCRLTNPHVVELYKKYRKKGFDIFNVSLDGLDDRRAAQFKNNPAMMEKAMELERQKWKQAIKDDKLTWKNHVSELRSWSSPIALRYGVSSIPKTFVLDKKGVIRYQNLRGQALEDAIKTLLDE